MAKSQDSDNRNSRFPSELIAQFLENQSKELENATKEIELKKFNEQNAFEYGCKALETQKEDRKEQRTQLTLFMKYGFWLTIFVLLLMSVFVAGCIYTNNINIIVSVLKAIAYVLPSVVGGYFIGLNRGRKSSRDTHSTYAEVVED
ncbi:MAG: hypothetical protein GDA42_04205 [Ekhidna sp.]|nr:hypothetical protein [Ekhidna sp.]